NVESVRYSDINLMMLSMVNVIEIRLGMLSCGSKSAAHAVAVMVVLVSSALLLLYLHLYLCFYPLKFN
ncbi:hypothetical protein SESBI_48939, partial [Sesbania bispinosa]